MKLESEVEMTLVPVVFYNELLSFIRARMTHLECHELITRAVEIGKEGQQMAKQYDVSAPAGDALGHMD